MAMDALQPRKQTHIAKNCRVKKNQTPLAKHKVERHANSKVTVRLAKHMFFFQSVELNQLYDSKCARSPTKYNDFVPNRRVESVLKEC